MKKTYKKIKLLIVPSKKNNYRPYFLLSNFLFAFILALILLKIISFSFLCFFPRGFLFSAVNRSFLLTLTNQKRVNLSVPSLKEDYKLNQAAYLKAKDMLNYDYFAHTSPSGKTPWYWLDRVGYNYQYAGENLAIDFVDSEELFQAWYSSSTHKENIINPKFRDIGMAVVSGNFKGRRTTVVVQFFGKKLNIQTAQAKEKNSEMQKTSPLKTASKKNTKIYYQSKKPVSTPGNITLYEYYVKKGEKFPSIRERAQVYEKLGLGKASSYYGADWQNVLLVNKLISIDNKNLEVKEGSSKKELKEKTTKATREEEKKTKEEITKKEEKDQEISQKITKPEIERPISNKISFLSKAKQKSNSTIVRILNFFVRNYDELTKFTFLFAFIIVFASLCIDVFVKIRIQHKDIVLRGTIYSLILILLFILENSVIIKMIPHNLGII